jgi:integrase
VQADSPWGWPELRALRERGQKKQNCRQHAVCERWFLHKFRANFATELLRGRNGDPPFSIEDVRYLMGHKDLESIQRYVTYVKDKTLRARIAVRYSGAAVNAIGPLRSQPADR